MESRGSIHDQYLHQLHSNFNEDSGNRFVGERSEAECASLVRKRVRKLQDPPGFR